MPDDRKSFMIEGANIILRNFSGKEDQYNREGNRNFLVTLDEKTAQEMLNDGWNIKYLKPREEGDDPTPYIQVAVGYKVRPPRIVLITSKARANIDEDTVDTLDWVNIANADLIANGYTWEVNGKTGIKAYLQSLFITVEEDYLERKYAINEPEER